MRVEPTVIYSRRTGLATTLDPRKQSVEALAAQLAPLLVEYTAVEPGPKSGSRHVEHFQVSLPIHIFSDQELKAYVERHTRALQRKLDSKELGIEFLRQQIADAKEALT